MFLKKRKIQPQIYAVKPVEKSKLLNPSPKLILESKSEDEYVNAVSPIPQRTDFQTIKQKRKRIALVRSDKENLFEGVLKDGRKYSVRENRDRFFFPDEWMNFFDKLKTAQKMTFEILINTGARYNEAFNIKVGDCDLERGNIILRVTKIKAREGEKNPRPRTISISSQFNKKLSLYIRQRKLKNDDYLGLLSRPAAHICLKKTLQRAGIKDWYMFGLHNCRKTHGNWLKALGIDSGEICIRLGHDYNTFLKHYASPNIFNYKDLQNMRLIIGDVYQK